MTFSQHRRPAHTPTHTVINSVVRAPCLFRQCWCAGALASVFDDLNSRFHLPMNAASLLARRFCGIHLFIPRPRVLFAPCAGGRSCVCLRFEYNFVNNETVFGKRYWANISISFDKMYQMDVRGTESEREWERERGREWRRATKRIQIGDCVNETPPNPYHIEHRPNSNKNANALRRTNEEKLHSLDDVGYPLLVNRHTNTHDRHHTLAECGRVNAKVIEIRSHTFTFV